MCGRGAMRCAARRWRAPIGPHARGCARPPSSIGGCWASVPRPRTTVTAPAGCLPTPIPTASPSVAPAANRAIGSPMAAAPISPNTSRCRVSRTSSPPNSTARRARRLGELIFADAPLPAPDPAAVTAALFAGIRTLSLDALPWTDGLRRWCERVAFLRRVAGPAWPDVGDAALLAQLEDWLAPYLLHCSRRSHLAGVDLAAARGGLLTWEQQRERDTLAPTHLAVPSGSRVARDYGNDPPVLAVRLQEMFGARDTPRLAGGKAAVLLHLLSPARRPVQVTQDLVGFWHRSYHDV